MNDLCPRDPAGNCRIAELGYWKCTTEPPSCVFKDAAHAERVLELCRLKKRKEAERP